MYIDKISKFLSNYNNIKKSEFINILDRSNIGFDDYKLEKDFLLTLILIKFGEKYPNLVFKWWTCLNKIYLDYFRLSEDLDFVVNIDAWRNQRKRTLKQYEEEITEDLALLGVKPQAWRTKFDEYRLAMFTFEYKSVIDDSTQTIKIDISAKSKLVLEPVQWKIKAIFFDKIHEKDIFEKHYISCINLKEAVAEKIRAWLTRKTPAIRDFFDIRYIKHHSDFNFQDPELKKLIIKKLEDVNFEYTVSLEDMGNKDKINNYNLLKMQIETDLKPVLKDQFDFDLPEIYKFILDFKH